LRVLKLEQKIAKLKKRLKSKNPKEQEESSSPSNEEANDSSSNESTHAKKGKGKKKHGSKPSYNSTSFNYDTLPSNHSFTSVHSSMVPHFDGMNYAKWHHGMKVHLISLNLSVWKVVCTCVDFLEEGETLDYNQLQQIHYNAQASNVLLTSLEKRMSMTGLMGLKKQVRYGKHFGCFMKELDRFERQRLRCLRASLIDL
jgi:hypothetical protein